SRGIRCVSAHDRCGELAVTTISLRPIRHTRIRRRTSRIAGVSPTLLSILVVLGLILVEALFVASEIALVSLRESQVDALAQQGRRGQLVAKLVKDQNRWLATVQIGVTLAALPSSAYGAGPLSGSAKEGLIESGMS